MKSPRYRILALSAALAACAAQHGRYAQAGQFRVFDAAEHFDCSSVERVGCSGLFPPRELEDGNRIALLTNGEASVRDRFATIKRARKSIRIQALIFTGDEAGIEIAKILKQKKAEGVDVRVIVDSTSNFVDGTVKFSRFLHGRTTSFSQTRNMYFDLKQHGIAVEGYETFYLNWINDVNPVDPTEINKRFHDKLWIVDAGEPDAVAIMGGMNVANEYFRTSARPDKTWRDQDIRVTGPVIDDLTTAFDRDFEYFKAIKSSHPGVFNTDKAWNLSREFFQATGHVLPKNPIISKNGHLKLDFTFDTKARRLLQSVLSAKMPEPHEEQAAVRFFQSRPRFGESYIHQAYIKMMHDAREEILISNAYFVPTPEILEAIKDAARRGVSVTILTNSAATNDLPQMNAVSRTYYRELIEANPEKVRIFEWEGNKHGEGTNHAKFAIFDRKASIVGSYNLDPRSQFLNSETVMAYENEPLAKDLASFMIRDDLAKSRMISLEEARTFKHPKDFNELRDLLLAKPFEGML